ncbi:PTS mannitol transporter subunit IICBA [Orbaceae bacterium ESL0727]|nr:PTS mannitol transporter subunit IICBA [Orbaceae bacterium ESL0727]
MSTSNIKLKVQNFGRFLSNMVMPNIGAFIAWGFITAIFLYNAKDPNAGGWFPNEAIATAFIGPMISYLLPLLIGYTGGKLVYGERGGVVGAVTTIGVIVGSSIPMFLGAMIAGPLGGYVIKQFDRLVDGKIKSGFEMLVNNFSAGIIGMILALISYFAIGPSVVVASNALAHGVDFMVAHNLLPLTSIIVEPAKILFLNNAINHGVFTPLGVTESVETGKSIFFLIEANPGPGLGLLLAYMFFGKGDAKGSASGAAIIHFFGGIHEIYFPYVLMNPRLIIAVILGGMTGVFTLTIFHAGLTAPASPGSIFAVMGMAKGSYLGVTVAVIAATIVSFIASAILLKTTRNTAKSLDEAKSDMLAMKKGSPVGFDLKNVKKIIVACDAGMGSSAMGAGILRKKIQDANLDILVTNLAINNLPTDADIVITHKDLTERAKQYAPNAQHISLTNFLDSQPYSQLVTDLLAAQKPNPHKTTSVANTAANTDTAATNALFKLSAKNIFLGLTATNKEEAIRFAGQKLVENGYVKPAYIDAMLEREKLTSTYLGESIAVPHGTINAKDNVITTGIVFCQYPDGVQFGDDPNDKAKIVIGIAARNNEHLDVIAKLTNALDDVDIIAKLTTTNDINEVLTILS